MASSVEPMERRRYDVRIRRVVSKFGAPYGLLPDGMLFAKVLSEEHHDVVAGPAPQREGMCDRKR